MKKLSKEQWAKARVQFETDSTVTCSTLAKQLGVTRQAVDKRMRQEGWEKATTQALEVAQDFKITETANKATPELLAQFINCMALMRNEKLACDVIGVDQSTVYRWKEQDESFAKAVQTARASKVTSWLSCVDRAAQNDYKAALELLKRAPETRDTFGETRESGPTIVLNITRS
jgi:hypothetical protein